MGCFPGCFGGRKNRRRQRRREDPRSNKISEGCTKDVSVSIVEEVPKSAKDVRIPAAVEEVTKVSVIPTTHICEEKAEERNSPSPSLSRKRVTFDSKVKTYEHVAVDESIEEEEVKSNQAPCSSEGSDVTSNSSTSFPSNHRYQNCRESDDEEEEDAVSACDESDPEDDDDDDGGLLDEDYYDDDYEEKQHNWDNNKVYTEEIPDNVLNKDKSNTSARDRTGYVNAVLNPIENLSQWKAVKSKGRTMQTQSRKENNVTLISDQEHKLNASFSLQEPQVVDELPSFSLKPKSRDGIKRSQEVPAVDASLSTWLSTSKTTTSGCSSVSMGVQSYDERPILGALTSEEIKQFSATNSPRQSPSRSPESPIIGTVGGYWNSHSMATSR